MHQLKPKSSTNFDKERRFLALLDSINRTSNNAWIMSLLLMRARSHKANKK